MSRIFVRGAFSLIALLALLAGGIPTARADDPVPPPAEPVWPGSTSIPTSWTIEKVVVPGSGELYVAYGACGEDYPGLYPAMVAARNLSNQTIYQYNIWRQRYSGLENISGFVDPWMPGSVLGSSAYLRSDITSGLPHGELSLEVGGFLDLDDFENSQSSLTPMRWKHTFPQCGWGTPPGPATSDGGTTTPVTRAAVVVRVVRTGNSRRAVAVLNAKRARNAASFKMTFRKRSGAVRHRVVTVRPGATKRVKVKGLKRGSKFSVVIREKGKKAKVYRRVMR